MSAFSFAAARGITAYKAPPGSNAKPTGAPTFPGDLVRNDEGNVDLGDLQMLIITLLAAGVYLLQVFHFLGSIQLLKVVTLPDVDTTILGLFGLGQGAYLVKKGAGNVRQS